MELRGFFTSYENVNERFIQSIEGNKKDSIPEINASQSTYVIFAMGDSHVGGTNNLDLFLTNAYRENALATVMVGDLTNGHRADYEIFSKHFSDKSTVENFPIVGNHDLYFNGWKNYNSIFGSSTYYFVVNALSESDLYICLDSGGGTLGDKQLDWFKWVLETKRSAYRYCVVFSHNNVFRLRQTVSTTPFVEEIHVFTDLTLRYNVNMVVTGHDHRRNSTILGNTTHIILDALQDINNNASYLKIHVSEEKIDYSFVEP